MDNSSIASLPMPDNGGCPYVATAVQMANIADINILTITRIDV